MWSFITASGELEGSPDTFCVIQPDGRIKVPEVVIEGGEIHVTLVAAASEVAIA